MSNETKPINDGGPAFAVPFTSFEVWCHGRMPVHGHPGMTLRDYFAGQVLAGAATGLFTPAGAEALIDAAKHANVNEETYIAQLAYRIADAMLAARNQTP